MAAGTETRPEPFLLAFTFLEILVLCNKNIILYPGFGFGKIGGDFEPPW
jgi:hypothetical protein